jgi:hypothetical protein
MLFYGKSTVGTSVPASSTYVGKSPLPGGYGLPASTADTGKIGQRCGHDLLASTADSGKIRLGGGYRLPVRAPAGSGSLI